MGKKIFIITVMIAIILGAGILVLIPESRLAVKQIAVERGPINHSVRVTGRVINDKTVTMTALLDGQIEGMLVQKGDSVKANQVLAYLDKREADALLLKAQAVMAREEQAVNEAHEKFIRLRDVKAAGGSTQQLIDDAEAEYKAAKARQRVASAEYRVAQIQREKIELRAPFAGVITEKTTEVGQWVEAGTKLFTLVGHAGREIEVKVDAGDSGTVKLGQNVRISCDAYPGIEWQEKIHWIAPSIIQDEKNQALNTFAVRISLSERAPQLLLGQQVDAHILIEEKENVLRLPFSALMGEPGHYRVAVAKNQRIAFKEIHTGLEDDTHIEIIDGLAAGERVILPDGKQLQAGQAVDLPGSAGTP